MNTVEIKINNICYVSIGDYMDNNDGIMHYWPDNKEDWIDFFLINESIVVLWTLSYLQSQEFDFDGTLKKIHNYISKSDAVLSFLKKYCWQSELGSMFIDFVFGEYSAYGDKELPMIIFQNEVIDPGFFEFDNHIFIQKAYYADFINELNIICELIIKELKK